MKKILKDGPFNRISRDVITNKELSLKAKGLLTLILGLPDNWVFTIVGLQEYVQEALLSAMRELIEKGYAVRETRRTQNGRFCPDDYSFYEIPFSFSPQAGNPSAENTVEDMRDTESPEVENPLGQIPSVVYHLPCADFYSDSAVFLCAQRHDNKPDGALPLRYRSVSDRIQRIQQSRSECGSGYFPQP